MKNTVYYLRRNTDRIMMVSVIVISLVLRYLCRDYESGDFNGCLKVWVDEFIENGRWRALKKTVGNYNVVYQYILILLSYIPVYCLYTIKIVSVIFDFFTAWGCARCLRELGADLKKQRFCFALVILLPTVWLNSSFWAQCDSIYVCFIVWSLYFVLKRKNVSAMAFLAVAFSFKLQTVFIMPVYLILFLKKKIKFRELWTFPLTYIITCIPAMICGKSFADIVAIYLNQTREYSLMVMNAPSALALFDLTEYNPFIEKFCIAICFLYVLVFSLVHIIKNNKDISNKEIISLFMAFSVTVPFLLPHMHDRYFYIADIISVIYVFVFGIRRILIPLSVQLASLICYMQYFGYINLYGGTYSAYIFNGVVAAALIFLMVLNTHLYYWLDFWNKGYRRCQKWCFAAALLLVVSVFGMSHSFLNQKKIQVKVDNKAVNYFGTYPHKQNGYIMMPLRGLFNACRYNVIYDYNQNCIKVSNEKNEILLDSGSNIIKMNGVSMTLKVPIMCIDSTNYISDIDFSALINADMNVDGQKIYFNTK